MSDLVADIRSEFPALEQSHNGHPLVYLDTAASALKPRSVIERISKYYSLEAANVHRGAHFLSDHATGLYENAREAVREFISADSADEIVFTRGTTESINLVAHSYGGAFLQSGDAVLITEMEHHANIVPWQELAQRNKLRLLVAPITDAGELDMEVFRSLLAKERVRLVALTEVSNTLGTINDVRTICRWAREKGARILIDGAQAINHHPVSVKDLDCDFYVFSGHKLFGPTGIGVLYGKRELLESMPPYQVGGSMISQVRFEKTTYNSLPYRFEAGTPHVAGAIGLHAAIDFIKKIGWEKITQHEKELRHLVQAAFLDIEGLKIFGEPERRSATYSFQLADCHASDVGALLSEQGIAVRCGHHCTQPLMEKLGVTGTVRASFSIYNNKQDLDRLIEGLKKTKEML